MLAENGIEQINKLGDADGEPQTDSENDSSTGSEFGLKSDGNLPAGSVDAAISSPPYAASLNQGNDPTSYDYTAYGGGGQLAYPQRYGTDPANLGNTSGPTFWSAAREILLQCEKILKPGGYAVWVVKAFVRDKALVDFPGQWRRLCEATGFVFVEEIHASVVQERRDRGLFDAEVVKKKERKSFFRRDNETKASARKWWQADGLPDHRKELCLVRARVLLESQHRERVARAETEGKKPPRAPSEAKILLRAQVDAYKAAKQPPVELETRIDHEVVLILRKLEGAKVEGPVQVDCVAGSPPFSGIEQPCASQSQAKKDYHAFTRGRGSKRDATLTEGTPGQLGAMPAGSIEEAI